MLFFVCPGCVSKFGQNLKTSLNTLADNTKAAILQTKDKKDSGGYYMHTVKLPNESISIIAEWFTGNAMNWKELAKCNPTIKPDRIFLGDTIKIPHILMTRWKPIPQEFVAKYQTEPKKKHRKSLPRAQANPAQEEKNTPPVLQPAPEPEEDEIPLLFGPKNYPRE